MPGGAIKMINSRLILRTRSILMAWGRQHYQDFPWRQVEDPWLALVAEVLLQRTKAAHVAKYWPEIIARFPSPESILSAGAADLALFDQKFGLDRRGRTIRELAEYLDRCDYYPDDIEELTTVYGIGHYTASAYLSLHMNVRAVLVDANIARWLCRFFGLERPADLRRSSVLWELAQRLTPKEGFREYSYSVLDFTMQVCKPRKPDCSNCPVAITCRRKWL
jgi:A/G-specific adenine glycosylase